ncbi:hypothetical protein [Nostoc sp.]
MGFAEAFVTLLQAIALGGDRVEAGDVYDGLFGDALGIIRLS